MCTFVLYHTVYCIILYSGGVIPWRVELRSDVKTLCVLYHIVQWWRDTLESGAEVGRENSVGRSVGSDLAETIPETEVG